MLGHLLILGILLTKSTILTMLAAFSLLSRKESGANFLEFPVLAILAAFFWLVTMVVINYLTI